MEVKDKNSLNCVAINFIMLFFLAKGTKVSRKPALFQGKNILKLHKFQEISLSIRELASLVVKKNLARTNNQK
jgi:hypothetical protein